MKTLYRSLSAVLLAGTLCPCWAHHGGTSTSQGPGTPIETNTPLTLPKGGTVVYSRAEIASFRKFADFHPENIDSFQFYSVGVSHGLLDCLTATVTLPYTIKTQDSIGTAHGIGDARFALLFGFNYTPGEGLKINEEEDTAVNLGESNKTYFGVTTSMTTPLGQNRLDLNTGTVQGPLQPGFGTPSFQFGLSMVKGLNEHLSIAADTSYDVFTRRQDGQKYGNEWRVDVAGVYEIYADKEAFFQRLDGVLELNYLNIARDQADFLPEEATGGQILYLTPGFRTKVGDFNFGAGVKLPIATRLNEHSLQQGSEGKEKVRYLFTVSTYF